MTLAIIVAMGENRVIGQHNQMPWHLPRDLHYFKKMTLGKTVVMGHNTYKAIGQPLEKRSNIILSRDKQLVIKDCEVAHSIKEVLEICQDELEVFIIGGAEVYQQFLPYVNLLYITRIKDNFAGDKFFPKINWENWEEISKKKGIKDENNPYDYYFCLYRRKVSS